MKTCSKCKREQPHSEFYKRKSGSKDGLVSRCRTCLLAYNATRKESLKENARRWRAKNPEREKDLARKWVAANPDKVKAKSARWAEAHPERVVARSAAFRESHPTYVRDWAKANPERALEYGRTWRQRNPEKVREKAHRRRIRLKGQPVEAIDPSVLYERDGGHCGICHKPVAKEAASIDHVLPVSKGGGHTYANTRIAHLTCNVRRGNRGAAQLRLVG